MSVGRFDAWILPAPWKLRTPSLVMVTATETFVPSPTYVQKTSGSPGPSGTSLTMPGATPAIMFAACRPNATTAQGTRVTLQANPPAAAIATTSAAAPPSRAAPRVGRSRGISAASAAAAASPISARSQPSVPMAGTSSRLNARAPAMAPIVLAA